MGRIVNETRLNYYTEKLWERIKRRKDDNCNDKSKGIYKQFTKLNE